MTGRVVRLSLPQGLKHLVLSSSREALRLGFGVTPWARGARVTAPAGPPADPTMDNLSRFTHKLFEI
jgi:hypothetical protein